MKDYVTTDAPRAKGLLGAVDGAMNAASQAHHRLDELERMVAQLYEVVGLPRPDQAEPGR